MDEMIDEHIEWRGWRLDVHFTGTYIDVYRRSDRGQIPLTVKWYPELHAALRIWRKGEYAGIPLQTFMDGLEI